MALCQMHIPGLFAVAVLCTVLQANVPHVTALDNGLALTPPMGWLSWERFRCYTDCVADPDNCVSENLYKTMADLVVSEGYRDLGYEYINMDDCWMASSRDADGRLYGDPTRFPSGIKALADYIHSKGLKLGIYESMGTGTCQGLPGTFGHIETDAQTFADWGIDMVKMDTCHTPGVQLVREGFMNFSRALNATGRPILFSCEWPHVDPSVNYSLIAETCNTIRNYMDIQDTWDVVLNIIDHYAAKQDLYGSVSGPGSYPDPDMLIVGDYALSEEQSKSQMALYSIMAAQLSMSNDLRTLAPWAKEILQNKEIIAVNQDPLGIMGKRVLMLDAKTEVWTKNLTGGSFALVIFSKRTDMPHNYMLTPAKLNYTHAAGYKLRDLFLHKDLGTYQPGQTFSAIVNPTGSVMIRGDPVTSKAGETLRMKDNKVGETNTIEEKDVIGNLQRKDRPV